jgi:hypothetical protein
MPAVGEPTVVKSVSKAMVSLENSSLSEGFTEKSVSSLQAARSTDTIVIIICSNLFIVKSIYPLTMKSLFYYTTRLLCRGILQKEQKMTPPTLG